MISQEHKETFSKGDRVFVTSVEREGRLSPKACGPSAVSARGPGTVRGPGTKQFRGLLRVLYADGSQYHVKWDAECRTWTRSIKVRRLGHGMPWPWPWQSKARRAPEVAGGSTETAELWKFPWQILGAPLAPLAPLVRD